MGRLRGCEEQPLFQDISEEVVDLFGVDDVLLFRYSSVDQSPVTDPLWNEPTTTVRFKPYKIKALYTDYQNDNNPSEIGEDTVYTNFIWLSLNHLIKAGVKKDSQNEYVSEGDAIRLFYKGDTIEYFIIRAQRTGFINDTEHPTGYTLDVKRNLKYVPERATSDEISEQP